MIGPAEWPVDGPGWLEALKGVTLIVRAGFDDDPMLRAAVRLGVPVVVMRGGRPGADVISFRHHGPCPHAALDIPLRTAEPVPEDGSLAVVAGTLAATEAAWRIACPDDGPRARHLKLSLDEEPMAQDIPWAPECFLCGGSAPEAVSS
jgi:antitoxin (DNA-binding transcriptional repressor) of toxin-antitoxin stability system